MTSLVGPLTKEHRLLLAEALRRAELEGRRDNPVWRELLDRAGGPSLKMPARALHISVRIAAFDKRIQGEAWRNLEPGRKELLLPLRSEEALREGAQHVAAMKLSHRDTKAYVKAHLPPKEKRAKKAKSRFFVRRVASMTKRLDTPFRKSVAQAFTKGTPEERANIKDEITALRDLAAQLLADRKGK